MRRLGFVVLLVFAAGCASTRYSTYVARTGLSRAEVVQIVESAAREFKMAVVDIRKSDTGELEVLLGERKDSKTGSIITYHKDTEGWKAVANPEGTYRAWAIP